MSSFFSDEPDMRASFSCSCGRCTDYLDLDNGQVECGRCGCLPLEHKFLLSTDKDNELTSSLSQSSEDNSDRIYEAGSLKRPYLIPTLTEGLWPAPSPVPPKKKSRVELVDHSPDKSPEEGLLQMKPCKLLERSHFPISSIADISNKVKGVYKIAYDYKPIFVGRDSCFVKKALNAQMKGYGHPGLHTFLKGLTPMEFELVSVAWLDEDKHVHTCKKSYLKCLENVQGGKLTIPDMTKPEANKQPSCAIL